LKKILCVLCALCGEKVLLSEIVKVIGFYVTEVALNVSLPFKNLTVAGKEPFHI